MINEDNVIINTPEKELETEPQNIPQGEKPFINPNPGYGEDGETKPAIKTVPFPGERGIRSDIVTPLKEGIKVEQNLVNFLKGLLIKGKPLEEYIDSEGGVTEAELQAALANYYKKSETYSKDEVNARLGNIDFTKLPQVDLDNLSEEDLTDIIGKAFIGYEVRLFLPVYKIDAEDYVYCSLNSDDPIITYFELFKEDDEWKKTPSVEYDLTQLGGTKLYKHTMGDIAVISNYPTAEGTSDLVGLLSALWEHSIVFEVKYADSMAMYDYNNDQLYAFDGGQFNQQSLSGTETDEVTEL